MKPTGIVMPKSRYLTTQNPFGVARYSPEEVFPVVITS